LLIAVPHLTFLLQLGIACAAIRLLRPCWRTPQTASVSEEAASPFAFPTSQLSIKCCWVLYYVNAVHKKGRTQHEHELQLLLSEFCGSCATHNRLCFRLLDTSAGSKLQELSIAGAVVLLTVRNTLVLLTWLLQFVLSTSCCCLAVLRMFMDVAMAATEAKFRDLAFVHSQGRVLCCFAFVWLNCVGGVRCTA
jgi:hypothetical protein